MDKIEYIIEWHNGEVINKGELIRCGQCRYGSYNLLEAIQCKIDSRVHRPDWFCADGKRKTKENEFRD